MEVHGWMHNSCARSTIQHYRLLMIQIVKVALWLLSLISSCRLLLMYGLVQMHLIMILGTGYGWMEASTPERVS